MSIQWSQRVLDAQAEVKRCAAALNAAQVDEYQFRCEEFPVKVGDIVETRNGGTYKVLYINHWTPVTGCLHCVKHLKDGGWGTGKHHIFYPSQVRRV